MHSSQPTYNLHAAGANNSLLDPASLVMLATSFWVHRSTNERPREDRAKLKTTATANRTGPGSRAARLNQSCPDLTLSDSVDSAAPPQQQQQRYYLQMRALPAAPSRPSPSMLNPGISGRDAPPDCPVPSDSRWRSS